MAMRTSVREALCDGQCRMLIDMQVPALDSSSRGFEPKLLARFAIGVAQEVDSKCGADAGPPMLLAHGLGTALACTQEARDTVFAAHDKRASVLTLAPGGDAATTYEDASGTPLDADALRRLAETDCPLVIVGPAGEPEHNLARIWRTDTDSPRVIVLLNHRPLSVEDPSSEGDGAAEQRDSAAPAGDRDSISSIDSTRPRNPLVRLARAAAARVLSPPPLLAPLSTASYQVVFDLVPSMSPRHGWLID